MNNLLGRVVGGITDFIQGVAGTIVDLTVRTPAPHANGEPVFLKPPTNTPFVALYDLWLYSMLPLGLAIWALMVIGIMLTGLLTTSTITSYRRRQLKHRTWTGLFLILGSWGAGAFVLHLANGITRTIAPTGEDVVASLGGFIGNIGAAGMAGILLWFVEGVLFLFLLLMLVTRWAAIYVLLPMLPVLLAMGLVDIGPLRWLAKIADSFLGMFVPFAFMTLPMAMTLRVGYTIVNELNSMSLFSQALLTGLGLNAIMILGFWIVAAVSPLFVFSQAGKMKPYAYLLAGAAAGASLSGGGGLRNRLSGLRNRLGSDGETPPSGAGQSHDVTEGSPYKRSNAGGFGGALGGDHVDGELPGGGDSGLLDVQTSGGGGSAGTADWANSAGGSGTSESYGTSTTKPEQPSGKDITRVTSRGELTADRYNVGYLNSNDEFQPFVSDSQGSTPEKLLGGQYQRLASKADSDELVVLRDHEEDTLLDIQEVCVYPHKEAAQFLKQPK